MIEDIHSLRRKLRIYMIRLGLDFAGLAEKLDASRPSLNELMYRKKPSGFTTREKAIMLVMGVEK